MRSVSVLSRFRKKSEHLKTSQVTRKNIKHEIIEAFLLLRSNRDVYGSLFLLALSQILLPIIAVITPGFASQVLGMKIEEFPLTFVAPAALGVFVGAVFLANLFHDASKAKLINIGLFLSGISMCILPIGSRITSREIVHSINAYLPHTLQITTIHFIVFLAFVLGLANAFVFVPANTILQEKTDDAIRGKIYGVLNSAVGLFSLPPIIIVGGLSDLIGVGRVIVGIGVTLLLLGVARVVNKF